MIPLLALLFSASPLWAQWTGIANFPGSARDRAVGFTIGGSGYVGTGQEAGSSPSNFFRRDFWKYTPGSGWSKIADLPIGRYAAVSFEINGKGYVFSGFAEGFSYSNKLYEYNPSNDTWTDKNPVNAPSGREYAASFVVNGKAYVCFGYTGSALQKETWEYDPTTNAFTKKDDLPAATVARARAAAFAIGSKGYVVGGMTLWQTPTTTVNETWEFNPAAAAGSQWTARTPFPSTARFGAAGFAIGSKGYVGAGQDASGTYLFDFWEFDPAGNGGMGSWGQKANFGNAGRSAPAAFAIGAKGFLGTGASAAGLLNDFYEFDPACTPATLAAPTVTQPSCETPTGTIVVNASGGTGGTLEYSVNGGTSWQTSNTFLGLSAGAYNVRARPVALPGCLSVYANNPLTINAPIGTPPTFTACPTAQTVAACAAAPTWAATATGDPFPVLSYAFSGATSGSGTGTGSGSTLNNGTTTVILTATNSCGATSCAFSLVLEDKQPPGITCPGNISVNTPASGCNAAATWTAPVGTDNCLGVTTVGTKNPGSTFPKGTTEVKYTATDASRNTKTCTFNITVTDNQPPTAICPANTTVAVNGLSCPGTVGTYALVSTSDNCTPSFSLTESQSQSPAAGKAVGAAGAVVTVTLTAKDDNGNTGSCFFTVTGVEVNATYYPDADGDGYGSDAGAGCQNKPGYVTKGGDCDDTNPAIHPGADEVCGNDIDENCNGLLVELNCPGASGSVSPACLKIVAPNSFSGEMLVTFGGEVAMVNPTTRVSATVGQPFVGDVTGANYSGTVGFWGRLLVPPAGPVVEATEGDLPDRVQIKWRPDPLSPASTSYNIYRDGVLLNSVSGEIRSMIDFNVIAGQIYRYEVTGVNGAGEGGRGATLGFVNPNGVVTGQVKTKNDNPVNGALVYLTPNLGAAVAFDGVSRVFAEYSPKFPQTEFTVSCWAKMNEGNNETGIFDLGSSVGKNWWLHATTPATGQKGVKFGIGNGPSDKTTISYTLPDNSKNDWHYYAACFKAQKLVFFVDGEMVGSADGKFSADSTILYVGKRTDEGGYFKGNVDDLRFFNRALSQTEISQIKNYSVQSTANGLVAYWKFDEGSGTKAFDISPNRFKAYLCGAIWDTKTRASILNAGISDKTGFYKIEGVNYSAGMTFTAVAEKIFHFNQSLEFNATLQNYAELTDFNLPDSTTLELTARNFDFTANQTLLSKPGKFNLKLVAGNVELTMGGTTHSFGPMGTGFHRLSFVMKQTGSTSEVSFFNNGTAGDSRTFSSVVPDFAGGGKWLLGKNSTGNFFSGLIDEVAIFSKLLVKAEMDSSLKNGTDENHTRLLVYFGLNEGEGGEVSDMGSLRTGSGKIFGAGWSTASAHPDDQPHVFNPESRLVTLNPSITSVDQVNFTDESTVPISGSVRFENTDCFQRGVEILVNGKSHEVPIYTNAKGEFRADFEPGKTVLLTPKFEDQVFSPVSFDLKKVTIPVAGILFQNKTKRQVVVFVDGGDCKKTTIQAGEEVEVVLETLNRCFSKTLKLTTTNSNKLVFNGVPPDSVTVAVKNHSNPLVGDFFKNLGGTTRDLRKITKPDTTVFTYYSKPVIEMTDFPKTACGGNDFKILTSFDVYSVDVNVFQDYAGGKCQLDSVALSISNLISGGEQLDTLMAGTTFKYGFRAGVPIITAPYLKSLSITATANEQKSTVTQQAVVVGDRPKEPYFVTTTPQEPMVILRDPPGDASYAYWEKGSQICTTNGYESSESHIAGGHALASFLPTLSVTAGFLVTSEVESASILQVSDEFNFTTFKSKAESTTVCVSPNQTLSTASDDLLTGADADVFMGAAQNLIISETDKLYFDQAKCEFLLDKGVGMAGEKFHTTFVYSRYHILNEIIPNLIKNNKPADAMHWKNMLVRDSLLQANSKNYSTPPVVGVPNFTTFDKNLSFSSGLSYEQNSSDETSTNVVTGWSKPAEIVENSTILDLGYFLNNVGISGGGQYTFSQEKIHYKDVTNVASKTSGFVLSDDDPGDNFSVDVFKDNVFGTYIFKTKSGQSSCPHEPNTQPRDEVDEIGASVTQISGVPENEAAVFVFTLGNISQSNDVREYIFGLNPESNVDGAIVKINGGTPYDVPFGITPGPQNGQKVTVTVERGPAAYSYKDLEFEFFAACEDDRAVALGVDADRRFLKNIKVDVDFLKPCSQVSIYKPEPDWVITPAENNKMKISVTGYDTTKVKDLKIQYRRSNGDGLWQNIETVPKADLISFYHEVEWEFATLKDGFYEIRVVASCDEQTDHPCFSQIVKGKLERTPPELFGSPEPADRVFSMGDEISFTFNEPIQCDQIIKDVFSSTTGLLKNNIGLYLTRTKSLVDFDVNCKGDKIVVVPKTQDKFLENENLRLIVRGIKDMANNSLDSAVWEFVVDRNPLNWLDNTPVYVAKYGDEVRTETRRIENRGGLPASFSLDKVPDWVKVSPRTGTLAGGQVLPVTFVFDSTLAYGSYGQTVQLSGTFGDEPMPVTARVVCHDPGWKVNAADWQHSMNLAVALNIERTLSEDIEDIVGAFVDWELRGTAKVQKVQLDTTIQ